MSWNSSKHPDNSSIYSTPRYTEDIFERRKSHTDDHGIDDTIHGFAKFLFGEDIKP